MAEKNLPIKFFEKREKDESQTEGGGGGKLPEWVLTGRRLAIHSRAIRGYFTGVSKKVLKKAKADNHIPTVFKIKLHEDATAKSWRGDFSRIFNVKNKINVIGVMNEGEMLVKVDSIEDLKAIDNNFSLAEDNVPGGYLASGISAISVMEDFKPSIEITNKKEKIFKAKLINYQDYELNQLAKRSFETFCASKKITAVTGRYSDQNIYRIETTADNIGILEDFDGLMSVSEMPTFDATIDDVEVKETIPVLVREKGKQYPTIGVLDTGIANIPHLEQWIVKDETPSYPPAYQDHRHGTFVSGVLLYGDQLEGQNHTGLEGCIIKEAIVYPDKTKQDIREDELVLQIKEAILRHPDVRLWNLSLGTNAEASLHDFSDFAKELDKLQQECNVLIIKSAGNCENFKVGKPRSRIARSADSVRSLVVGSLAHDQGTYDLEKINNPSPFTRVGPGPAYLNKPDVVHYGGNAGMHAGRKVITGVKSFGTTGNIVKNSGTSFSTPRITALAAGIHNIINEPFNPLLLKALIIHSSKYPAEMEMDIADKIRMAGFGKPGNISDILYNDPNEITLIQQDTIERGTFFNILDFPYPQSLVDEDGFHYGEVTITLVTDPILEDAQQGAEYCQSNIDVYFGSYDEKKDRDTTKPLIKNAIGPDGNKNLLSDSLYSKRTMNHPDNEFRKERVLLSYGKKYQPVKKWVINLEELKDSNKEKFLKAPKQWYLKLTGLYRDHTETLFERNQQVPSQDFCLIVTIRDNRKKNNIYNEVSQLLQTHNFAHSNIKIREDVRIKTNN